MSEKAPQSPEQDPQPSEVPRPRHENPVLRVEKESRPDTNKSVENLRRTVEKEASPREAIKKHHKLEHDDTETKLHAPNSALKKHVLDQTLREVRRKLPKRQRQFSKFIHTPSVEQISQAASKTIARPSGLLAGGLFSLLGSVGLLVVSHYYGYSYNFLVVLACFGGGFLVGIVFEMLIRVFKR